MGKCALCTVTALVLQFILTWILAKKDVAFQLSYSGHCNLNLQLQYQCQTNYTFLKTKQILTPTLQGFCPLGKTLVHFKLLSFNCFHCCLFRLIFAVLKANLRQNICLLSPKYLNMTEKVWASLSIMLFQGFGNHTDWKTRLFIIVSKWAKNWQTLKHSKSCISFEKLGLAFYTLLKRQAGISMFGGDVRINTVIWLYPPTQSNFQEDAWCHSCRQEHPSMPKEGSLCLRHRGLILQVF